MSVRRQHNAKVNKLDSSKRKPRKEATMFTTMERYLGLDEIRSIIHIGEENIVKSDGIKKEYFEESSNELIVNGNGIFSLENEEKPSLDLSHLPNVRLSPRKHASTLSRCASTAKENMKTPHRISLCEQETVKSLSLNPYSKRTRRRLNVAAEEHVEGCQNNTDVEGNPLKERIATVVDSADSKDIITGTGPLCNGVSNKIDLPPKQQDGDYKNLDIKKVDKSEVNGFNGASEICPKTLQTINYKVPKQQVVNCKVPKQQVVNGKVPIQQAVNGKVIKQQETNGNRKLTDFFPIRRSVRKTKKEVQEEKHRAIELAILEEREEGLEVAVFEGKGRGVVAARMFRRGEFVVEYAGELVSLHEAKDREAKYAQDSNKGCYMYYFKHSNQHYCIDATAESGRLGRLVNHSRNGNLVTKPVFLHHRPHLVLLACQDIYPGEEVTYDYGDRSKESLLAHPWLAF